MEYDKYYQTAHLFGAPYPELIAFYTQLEQKGRLLDLGCGQGRDAIALARIGYEVTGVDQASNHRSTTKYKMICLKRK